MNITYVIVLILFGLFILSFIINLCFKSQIDRLNEELKHKQEAYDGVHNELLKVLESYKIREENEKKANEKVSDLHSGKLSADDILPKRKS